jgi:hypothetical protein
MNATLMKLVLTKADCYKMSSESTSQTCPLLEVPVFLSDSSLCCNKAKGALSRGQADRADPELSASKTVN